MAIAKAQHYVPQFLLRNFGDGLNNQVWVYDKTSDRAFITNVKNIAGESRFYDFEVQGESVTLEPFLSSVESKAKPVIESVLLSDSLRQLTDEDKEVLTEFLSIQLARTRSFREEWSNFPRMLRKHFQEHGDEVAADSQAAELLHELTENESKAETGRFIMEAGPLFRQHFAQKEWVLAATSPTHPFVIGDNPIARQNLNHSPVGNLGLMSPGIEIYLPLSPTRALAMWCTSLTNHVRREALLIQNDASRIEAGSLSDPFGVLALNEALTTGRPVDYSSDNVHNFNSLQITWSERYVFSSINDFGLARKMLCAEPRLKRGPQSQAW